MCRAVKARFMCRALFVVAALTGVTQLGLPWSPASAAATTVGPVRMIAGTTPFPGGCPPFSGNPDSANVEYEPYLVADPAKPARLTAVWIQDDGLGNVSAHSADAGAHWTRVLVPGVSHCTGGGPGGWVNPWLSRGPDGALYMVSLGADLPSVGFPYTNPKSEVVFNRSTDDGATWSPAVGIQPEDGGYYDKPSVTADPRTPGEAYAVWASRSGLGGAAGVTMFAKTIDGGRSWSTPAQIYDPGPLPQQWPHGNVINVLADGTLLDVFGLLNTSPFFSGGGPPTPDTENAIRSRDGGRTWSAAVTIATVPSRLPGTGDGAGQRFDALPIASVALDSRGTVYAAWHEDPSPTSGSIRISHSGDGGRTWSRPSGPVIPPGQALLPALAVDSSDGLGLLWYDSRNNAPGDSSHMLTDAWFGYSKDQGRTWAQTHVAGPFDALTAPDFFGVSRTIGAYDGLTAAPDGFDSVFTQARPAARNAATAVFSAHIRVAGPPRSQAPAPTQALRLTVRPRRTRSGTRTRFVFSVTQAAPPRDGRVTPVAGAVIALGGHTIDTNSRGRATITVTPHRPGVLRATAAKPGYAGTQTTIRVLPLR